MQRLLSLFGAFLVGVATPLLAPPGTAFAQNVLGSITGVVSDPNTTAVADAPIQAKSKETGAIVRTVSSSGGRYTLADLPAGTYDLSIAMPCCAFEPFLRENVTLQTGQTLQLDVRLAEAKGVSLKTLGDDPGELAALLRKRSVIPSGPAPRSSDGKPNLSGMWFKNEDRYPEQAAVLPWAAALAKERIDNNTKDHPVRPGPWLSHNPQRFRRRAFVTF